jgi:hypothetical protein
MPEVDEREQRVSIGQASDGTWKVYKYASSRKVITIPVHGLTTTNKTSLQSYLESSPSQMVKLVPYSHIDLGGGAGVEIEGQLLDKILDFQKTNHEYWSGLLSFGFGFPSITPNEDIMYFTNNVEITGTYESHQTLTTNSGGLTLQEIGSAYPSISLTTYKVTIFAVSSNGTEATFSVGNIQQSGANISFEIFLSAVGRPNSSDGKYYANITVALEEIV